MQNKTFGIIATVLTACMCLPMALFTCGFGLPIVTGEPFTTTIDGQTTQQTFPVAVGYVLWFLAFLMLVVPLGVGLFTLTNEPKSSGASNFKEPVPPAS